MGHTAEEKIKILYEDSLLDIREITGKIEALVGNLATIEIAIDRQKQGELSAAVRMEIAKAGDVQTARNEALSWAMKWTIVGVIAFSVAGFCGGYGLKYVLDASEIKNAESIAEKASADAKAAIDETTKYKTWVETDSGKAAYHFYLTSWPVIKNCDAPFMEKVGEDGCRMQQKYGWLGGNESPVWHIIPAKN